MGDGYSDFVMYWWHRAAALHKSLTIGAKVVGARALRANAVLSNRGVMLFKLGIIKHGLGLFESGMHKQQPDVHFTVDPLRKPFKP